MKQEKEWVVWHDCWKSLPEDVFFHILNFVDTIDIRRAFKMPLRKLKLTDEYKTHMTTFLINHNDGYYIKYVPISKTLHVIRHIYDDVFDLMTFTHKVIKNIEFERNQYGNTYFTNELNRHSEFTYKYCYESYISMVIEKITRAPYVLFDFILDL
jgi:hypothetical protein